MDSLDIGTEVRRIEITLHNCVAIQVERNVLRLARLFRPFKPVSNQLDLFYSRLDEVMNNE